MQWAPGCWSVFVAPLSSSPILPPPLAPTCSPLFLFFNYSPKDMLFYWFFFRKMERGKEKYQCARETLISCLPHKPPSGIEPAPWVYALAGIMLHEAELLAHFLVFQFTDISDIVHWAGNPLLNYNHSNCWSFKGREQGYLSCHHCSDVTLPNLQNNF